LPGTSPHQQGKDEDGNALARDHLVRALLKQRRHAEAGRLAVLRLITTSNLTGAWHKSPHAEKLSLRWTP
jgi:hypothetical protein